MNDPAVFDMFQWQSVLAHEGVLNPGLNEGTLDPEEQVREGLSLQRAVPSAGTQLEAFLSTHRHPEMPGYMANPEDMGVALRPKGNSLFAGCPRHRAARRPPAAWARAATGGASRASPQSRPRFRTRPYLSNTQNQIMESAAFG